MSTLLLYFFRLLIIGSIAILFIGLFRPEWLRYRGKQPDLLMTFAMAFGLFMAGFTGASKTYYTPDANITESAKAGVNISEAVYTNDMSATGCQPGAKPGEAGSSDDEKTDDGIHFSVRTPSNYLHDMAAHRINDYIFPSNKKGLSNMSMLAVLKRMKRTDITVHGFRSTFRDWAADHEIW